MTRRSHVLVGRFIYYILLPLLNLYFLSSKNIRAYGVIEHKGKVLLVKNWLGSGDWSFPGGGSHDGESLLDTLKREIHEETGLTINKKQVKLLIKGEKKRVLRSKKYVIFHVIQKDKPNIFINKLEIIDSKWVNKSDLLKLQPDSQDFQQVVKLLK